MKTNIRQKVRKPLVNYKNNFINIIDMMVIKHFL